MDKLEAQMVCIQLGTNIGDRAENLKTALKLLSKSVHKVRLSSIYETAPWGNTEQAPFYNQLILARTSYSPFHLLKICQEIENQMDRQKVEHWGPRIIDLDIIFYSNKIIFSPELTIPHPLMQERNFVLLPLSELKPAWIHPIYHKDIEQLRLDCKDTSEVNRLIH